ncbi:MULTISPECIES: hypothetical protein [Luteibacter]|uniref:hypothetical protein n=1 Tax=Luteibacter TaxID=242605 RepID=UPI000569CAD5|nr:MULTISPECIES: hypothetical protein [unclassified Luteibacter]
MNDAKKLEKLREIIVENLRVQTGTESDYIAVGSAMQDARMKQNHTIFARRGCGKTLLLHSSARNLPDGYVAIYLNCEDFKRHSFPNVLIEILVSIFRELERNLTAWFGPKRRARETVRQIIHRLGELRVAADIHDEDVRRKRTEEFASELGGHIGAGPAKVDAALKGKEVDEVERSFKVHREKLELLDRWLPDLKQMVRQVFDLSSKVKTLLIQIDDLYHLKRADQAFVVDYIHRLCKDLPLYFKIATLRHASTLYLDRDGQPIGAQERHDYQPINIDYTFDDFSKTSKQNLAILEHFGSRIKMSKAEISGLFKGEGFERLVMAGGGVPRDVLSLFLELLNAVVVEGKAKIGKDEVRQLSRTNFEQKIQELKQDSKDDEQDELIKGIYVIRHFCLEKRSNIFLIEERQLQQRDSWRALVYRLLDYRIIHSCATALTHKSTNGNYHAFAVDLGCYAHMRKLEGRFSEIDVSDKNAKDLMRSAPILEYGTLEKLLAAVPANAEALLLSHDEAA